MRGSRARGFLAATVRFRPMAPGLPDSHAEVQTMSITPFLPFIYIVIALILIVIAGRLANSYIPLPPPVRTIVNVVFGLIVLGIILFLIDTYIPMAGAIKGLLNVVVFLAACVGVLQAVGLWDPTVRWWTDFRNHRLSH
jgi:undecaprenyl pyrophosphate phosphatase UppP